VVAGVVYLAGSRSSYDIDALIRDDGKPMDRGVLQILQLNRALQFARRW
jgi:hypothetical protein